MAWLTLIVGTLAGLGVGSWISGRWERGHATREAEKQRQHASAEARAERHYTLRLEAYQAVSLYLSRQERWVNLTQPDWGTGEEPPKIEADEEWIRLGATIAISASDTVREALREAVVTQQAFAYAASEYARSREPGYRLEPDTSPGPDMHAARTAAIAAIHDAQTTMRDELVSL